MSEPIICFGQQPCGIMPKRFLQAKITKAREVQANLGGRIVFFLHDSDHDLRETMTAMRDLSTGKVEKINFQVANKIQKKYTPLYLKEIAPGWQESTARRLPRFLSQDLVDIFKNITETRVADFCLQMYKQAGLLNGIDVVRSSDPQFREQACSIGDCFVDVPYEGEIVRARREQDGELTLHQGGDSYLHLPGPAPDDKAKISPSRDSRLLWMQSVIHCTHYITGAGEMQYLNRDEAPEIDFILRHTIEESDFAYIP